MLLFIIAGVLVVVVAIVAYVFYRGYNKVKPDPVKGIPCPPLTHPILGHPDKMVHPLKHELRLEVTNAARAPIHQLVLMKYSSFFINDAEEAARLISEVDTKGKIYNAFRYNATVPDLLASDGEEHAVLRQALAPALEFLSAKLANSNVTEPLMKRLMEAAAKGEVVDFAKLSTFFAFDCVCSAAFNYQLDALGGSEDGAGLYNCLQIMAEMQASQGLYARQGARKVPPEELAASKTVWREFLEKLVKHVRADAAQGETLDPLRNFGHALVQLSQDRAAFDDTAMMNEIHQLLRHGQENIAVSLQWMVYALFRTKKLRGKLEKAVLEHTPDKEHPYPLFLECVVLETLRRYPSAGNMTVRTLPEGSDEEMIAGRFAVSAGQPMHIPIFTLQNSARTWYRPKEFLPERWMEGEAPAASAAASATGAESETATVDTSVGGLQQNTRPATNTAPFCPKCPFSGKSSSTPEEVIGDWQTLSTTKVEPMSDKFYDGVGFTDGSLAFFPFSAGARSCPAKLFAVQVLRDFLFELVSNIHLDPSGNLGDAVDLGESVNAVIAPQDKRSTTLKVRRILSLKGLVDNAPNSLEGDTAAENIDEGWADEDEEGEEDIQNS